jgi:hypothetical protein
MRRVYQKEKQAANPCHIAMLAMHFLEELSSSSNFFVAAAASFQVRCAEVWKKKEMTITGSLRLWLAAARRVLLYTQKRNFSFLCILGSAINKRQLGAERKESHTLLQSISILRGSFQSVLRFRCLAVKSHCVDQSPGSQLSAK